MTDYISIALLTHVRMAKLCSGVCYSRGNGKGRRKGRSGRNHPNKRLTRDDDDSEAVSGSSP